MVSCSHFESSILSVFLLLWIQAERETRQKQETKLKHQQQKLDVIIPAVSQSPCLQLVALTHLHKLSSHVYSFGVAAFKAPFVLCTKDQLDTLCRFPFLSALHCMPRQFLIDSSSSISHVMPKRDGITLKEKKESSTAILFNCQCRIQIKRKVSVMYSPHNPFLLWRQEHGGPLQHREDFPGCSEHAC